jgi:hypothetical protein
VAEIGLIDACNLDESRCALIQHEGISCPYCGEPIDIALDLSVDEQQYVEDCSVCCRPMVVSYRVEGSELAELNVATEGGE